MLFSLFYFKVTIKPHESQMNEHRHMHAEMHKEHTQVQVHKHTEVTCMHTDSSILTDMLAHMQTHTNPLFQQQTDS